MPQYEQRDNDGVIFENDRKQNDRHPDWTGKAMVGGVMYWVSGWTKEGRNGEFFTLSFKPMDEQPRRPQPARAPSQRPRREDVISDEPLDQEIPFAWEGRHQQPV